MIRLLLSVFTDSHPFSHNLAVITASNFVFLYIGSPG